MIGWTNWLYQPVDCEIIEKKSNSLLGSTFYFCYLKDWKINSPITGLVQEIYPDYTIKLVNKEGITVLVRVQTKKNHLSREKILQCEVTLGQKITAGSRLYTIYLEREVIAIDVCVPWQPEIIAKVKSNQIGYFSNSFAKIYYTNPYAKLKLKAYPWQC